MEKISAPLRIFTWRLFFDKSFLPVIGNLIAPLFINNYESFGSQPNIAYLDYSCLLAGLPGYSGYFDDICFQVASRWLKTETTESPKLAAENVLHLEGNVFKRETVSADDMERINGLIDKKIHDFEVTSAYVVSWFRITDYGSVGLIFGYFSQRNKDENGENDLVLSIYLENFKDLRGSKCFISKEFSYGNF